MEGTLANTYPHFDLVVVDQSADDRTQDTLAALSERSPRFRYEHTPPLGSSGARNFGARATSGSIVAFLDDDCAPPPGWIDEIVRFFAQHPEVPMLYGQVLLPPDFDESEGTVPVLPFRSPVWMRPENGFRLFGMSANLAVRREFFETLGGFDEMLGVGAPLASGEDFDFHYRAFLQGATIVAWPAVTVEHYGLRRHGEWPATLRRYGLGDGAFYLKHIRCGDLRAARLLVARLVRLTVRETLIALRVRLRPSQAAYLRACLVGMKNSVRFGVDRRRRLYKPAGRR